MFILLPLLLAACSESETGEPSSAQLNFNGSYKLAADRNELTRRAWNPEYWILNVENNKGQLHFVDGKSMHNFALGVRTVATEGSLQVYFDKVLFKGIFADIGVDSLTAFKPLITIYKQWDTYHILNERLAPLQHSRKNDAVRVIAKSTVPERSYSPPDSTFYYLKDAQRKPSAVSTLQLTVAEPLDSLKGQLKQFPNLHTVHLYLSDSKSICILQEAPQLQEFYVKLLCSDFTGFDCTFRDMPHLERVGIFSADYSKPLAHIDSEELQTLKNQLPENTRLSGLADNEIIRSDINLR